jgi:hypothetical protein
MNPCAPGSVSGHGFSPAKNSTEFRERARLHGLLKNTIEDAL